jgi:hypothetical protein
MALESLYGKHKGPKSVIYDPSLGAWCCSLGWNDVKSDGSVVGKFTTGVGNTRDEAVKSAFERALTENDYPIG